MYSPTLRERRHHGVARRFHYRAFPVPVAGVGDPHPRDFELARARDNALGMRRREPGAYKLDHVADSEAVRA